MLLAYPTIHTVFFLSPTGILVIKMIIINIFPVTREPLPTSWVLGKRCQRHLRVQRPSLVERCAVLVF